MSQEAGSFVSKKTGTEVSLEAIYLQFPNGVSIEKLYVEDQANDTLIYAGELSVSIDYFALLYAEFKVSNILLENTTANIKVSPDSSFNFDFIIDAFAGEEKDTSITKDTSSSNMDFNLGKIELKNVRFSYYSATGGISTSYAIGRLAVDVKSFDLKNQVYIANSIQLEQTNGRVELNKSTPTSSPPDTSAESSQLIVGANKLTISETAFTFIDKTAKTKFSTSIGELKFSAEPIDLNQQQIIANNLQVKNSKVKININSKLLADSSSDESTNETATPPWLMSLNSLTIENLDFSFDDAAAATVQKGIDYRHIGLNIDQLHSKNNYFNGSNDLGLTLVQLTAKEKSGLRINQAEFKLKLDSNSLSAKSLIIKTPRSYINANTSIGFENLSKIGDQLGDLKLDLSFNQTKFGMEDLRYFAPDLDTVESISPFTKQTITINGQIKGLVKDIGVKNLIITFKKSTTLAVNARIKGLPATENLSFTINQLSLKTKPADLRNLLPDSTIPAVIKLPEKIKINLSAHGSLKEITAQLKLSSSYGELNSNIAFQQKKGEIAQYQGDLYAPQFDLASLIKDDRFGNVGFTGEINGNGSSIDNMELALDATVSDFEYLNYQYSDLNIQGVLQEEAFEGKINMNDTNLIFSFNGKADLDSLKPVFGFTFKLEGIDLQRLNISKNDYRVHGTLAADFTGSTLEDLNGGLDIRDLLVIYKGKQYPVDSLLLSSRIDSGKTDISIKSSLIDASFKGNIYLADIAKTIEAHLKNSLSDSVRTTNSKQQDFKFNVKIYDPDILTDVILPDLNSFKTGEISGEFDSKKAILKLDLNFPKIDYLDIIIDSLSFSTNSDSNKTDSKLSIKRVSYDTLSIDNILFSAKTKGHEAMLALQVLDDQKEKILQLKGNLSRPSEEFQFHFQEQQQFINSKQWKVNQANKILFGENTTFKDLVFSNDSQNISIESMEKFHLLSFSNFKLSSVFNLISQNQKEIGQFNSSYKAFNKEKNKSEQADSSLTAAPPLLKGILNGKVHFPIDSSYRFGASLYLKDLQLSEVPLGNLKANYDQLPTKDSIAILLDGDGNHLQINGFVSEEKANIKLTIDKLKMNIIEAFSGGGLKNTQGYLSANAQFIKTNGSYGSNGAINFKNVRLKSQYLGETFFLQNEKIEFSNEEIILNKFTILDSAKQPFITNGSIGIKELSKPSFNLTVNIDHFQFLNTSKKAVNDLFHGKVIASADLKVTGNFNAPKVNAKLGLEKGTDIVFVVPEEEAAEVNREGIVVFVDKDEKIPLLLRRNKKTDTVKVDILGIDIVSIISIDDETKVTIVIDPSTGDQLNLQGGGEIRADVDPTGRVTMNGLYTIEEGAYELKLYNLVKRKFTLQKGSKLIWSGQPLDATMDIKGVFIAKASPLGLLGEQISNLTEAERNNYKKRIPFKVLLLLGGKILRPDISFRIELPEDQRASNEGTIANKLAQLNENESELNRQVFSLIILKRFYSQNSNSGGLSGSFVARESVSQILTQQLNSLSDKYVKGVNVELSVDSYSDYSSNGDLEGTTDLNLALSKNLFDDRVIVRVDGDFNVEDNSPQSSNSAIAGDVSVEYKITEDGKYKVKVFRKDEYEGIIEGEFIETGVSLIYNKEFVKFKDLFRKEENKTINKESE